MDIWPDSLPWAFIWTRWRNQAMLYLFHGQFPCNGSSQKWQSQGEDLITRCLFLKMYRYCGGGLLRFSSHSEQWANCQWLTGCSYRATIDCGETDSFAFWWKVKMQRKQWLNEVTFEQAAHGDVQFWKDNIYDDEIISQRWVYLSEHHKHRTQLSNPHKLPNSKFFSWDDW